MELATLETGRPLCFSRDGRLLATQAEDLQGVQFWDLGLIRQGLAALKLDWELPPLHAPAPPSAHERWQLTVLAKEEAPAIQPRPQAVSASVILGQINRQDGLELRFNEDGVTEPAEIGGRECRCVVGQPRRPNYVYFALAPSFKFGVPREVALEVEYFDTGQGGFHVEYDAAKSPQNLKGAYTWAPKVEALTDTKRWKTAVFVLTNARFRNTQNAGADFRLAIGAPRCFLRRVTVSGLAANPAPAEAAAQGTPAEIPPRDPNTKLNLLELTPHYNAGLKRNWHNDPHNNDLAELPIGVQRLAGTEFDVRGLIQVSAAALDSQYPIKVAGLVVERACQRLHFLHAAIRAAGLTNGTVLGRYVLHDANGQQRTVPLLAGRDLGDWHEESNEAGKSWLIAWTGANPKSRAAGKCLRLFKTTWENPVPNVPIQSVDFEALHDKASPFLIAITVE